MIDAATLAANLNDPLWRIGYVYTITNLVTGKVYVGSSVEPNRRFNLHRMDLVSGRHHSPKLQNSWNKHGEAAFLFEIVEEVEDANFLLAREQAWIWRFQDVLLNCSMQAGSPIGVKRTEAQKQTASERKKAFYATPEGRAHLEAMHAKNRGRKQSDEERAMRSKVMTGKKCGPEWTDEQRKAHSLALKGRKMPLVSEATRENISKAKKGVRRSPAANEACTQAARARNALWISAEKPGWIAMIAQGVSIREIERITGRSRKVIARECGKG